MKLKIVKGTRDLFGDDIERFQYLEEKAKKVFDLYGYREIRNPIFENTDLFAHGVGEDTDIVGKEMFLLQDRRGRSLALRPEETASVVRTVITNNLMQQNKHLRFYYMGPMFRYEQPQKGRFRQFYQIGAEYYGVTTPDADLELLLILRQFFHEIDLKAVSFQLNTIGCQKPECRPAFKKKLVEFLRDRQSELCDNCTRRMETNPLRVLDCKNPQCSAATQDAPRIYEEVCEECSDHFNELLELLKQHKVLYTLNARLVRGLDYYSRTVFEVYSENLGAQNAAGGGGRYDGLFEIYGAKVVPSIGFALGMDRLAMLITPDKREKNSVFVVGHERQSVSLLVARCREAGIACHYDPFQSSMKSQFRQANKIGADKVLILGEDELKNGQVSIKDMQKGDQITVKLEEVANYLGGERN
ncbi:MAG: histidine--tRNA ligase [Proteobacteria bacterium]|nr:histidine--tRNA ligase [Pseudomonadota bacterium]